MALSKIKQYLLHNEKASVKELSDLLSIEPSALDAMLKHMEAKGLVSVVTETACSETICSSKAGCLRCPFSEELTFSHTPNNTYVIWNNVIKQNNAMY